MRKNPLCLLVSLFAFILAAAIASPAATQYNVLYTFHGGNDGYLPVGNMISDAAGNLYGMTEFGGTGKEGTVFRLSPGTGGTWTETVLFNFSGGTDGGQPFGGLIFDTAGNLYGTAGAGGDPTCVSLHGGFCGVVFELTPTASGPWTETVLYSFTGTDGLVPDAGLVFDSAGNLYGTTYNGGTLGSGVVFKLSPNGNGTWTETVLHSLVSFRDGANPDSSLLFDSAGNLYGTANNGGMQNRCGGIGCGTIFELMPQSGGTWTFSTVHKFDQTHGANPQGIAFDSAGNLFGVTSVGGFGNCHGLSADGCGIAYKLTSTGGVWSGGNIHVFTAGQASSPNGALVDAAGNVFGNAVNGGMKLCNQGLDTCGTIYQLTPMSGGYAFSTLHAFLGGTDGQWPLGAMTTDSAGNLYGTTQSGGDLTCPATGGCGVVFQIIP